MKKLIKTLSVLMVIFLSIFIGFSVFKKNKSSNNENENSDTLVLGLPYENKKNEVDILFEGNTLRVNWFLVNGENRIYLYPNSLKLTSKEFKERNNCGLLTSAGYYKQDFSPTGLLLSEYQEISPYVKSSLANGIFSVNDFETPRITSNVPKDRLRLAIQAGPLLKENSFLKDLILRNDEQARRIVVGVTGENKAVFLAFYDSFSVFKGPYLKDLPLLIQLFEKETGIAIADALNLDGGMASAFVDSDINLPEATFVGSFFCIK